MISTGIVVMKTAMMVMICYRRENKPAEKSASAGSASPHIENCVDQKHHKQKLTKRNGSAFRPGRQWLDRIFIHRTISA